MADHYRQRYGCVLRCKFYQGLYYFANLDQDDDHI